jgi:general secretion pathway protein D
MKIFLLCLAFGIVSSLGMKTGLRAEPGREFFEGPVDPSTSWPEQGLPATPAARLSSPKSQTEGIRVDKAPSIFDVVAQASPSQPSAPTPTPSQPPTASEPPTPTPVQPSEVPTPKPVPPLQPQPLPAPSPPTPVDVPTPAGPPPSPRKRFVPQPSTSPTPQPSTSATRPPSGPIQPQPSLPTTGPGTAIAVALSTSQAGSGVVFNFDNADLYEVIRVMSEIMKINYIVDPKVRGVVNIHTSGQISAADVFPIFQSILRLNGATAVKRDGVYEIVPLGDAKKLPIPPSVTGEQKKPPSDERYTIQIIVLKYIPVAEVSKMIKPFLSDGADIVEHPPNNILIIGDLASNVKKCVDIINLFDIDIFTDLRVRIYPILNADVNEVAKELERIFASFEVSTKSGRGVGITFTPVVRVNSLLVVSSIPNIFEKVEGWLKELDKVPMEGTKYSVFVYYVQNAKAKDLADVLKQIYVTTKEKKTEYKEKVTTETTPRGVRPPPTPSSAPASTTTEGGAVPEGEINVVVDEPNNALVIRAFPRDYKSILETVKKLDIYPRQVLIEVLLADITLKDDKEFGIDLVKYLDGGKWQQTISFGEFAGLATAGPGISYSIVQEAGKFSAAIKAAATLGRLKVLTSPHLLASNSKEAKIQIGTSEPILTNTYTSTGTATTTTPTGFVEGTIEYKDIGTILSITPRISDGGLVTLELSIEESSLDSREIGRKDTGSAAAGVVSSSSTFSVPAFNKTTAKTVLSIRDGQTIAIGGLIRKTKDVSSQGVPLLSKIPLLGFFFGKNKRSDDRRELILLLTPHIITDEIQSKTVTDEFRQKIEGLRKDLEKGMNKKEGEKVEKREDY